MGKKKSHKNDRPSNRKVIETIAIVTLGKRTLMSPSFQRDLKHFVRFTSSIDPESNNGARLFIFDHRPEMIERAKGYKDRKSKKRRSIDRFIRNSDKPARVVVMEKPGGQFYVNIFPIGRTIETKIEMREKSLVDRDEKSFFDGDPFWSIIGSSGPETTVLMIEDADGSSDRKLDTTELEDRQAV